MDNNKLIGKLIDFGHADHGTEGDHGDHYRFIINGIEDGILNYTHHRRTEFEYKPYFGVENGKRVCTKIEPFEKEFDLNKIKRNLTEDKCKL